MKLNLCPFCGGEAIVLKHHAVEVVHCKNCRYWDGYNHSGRCEAPVNGLVRENTSANDFCSYGERKEGAGI